MWLYASYVAACRLQLVHDHARMADMSARRAPGPGRQPRGGIIRTRTTVRLVPEDKTRFEELADELGLSLTDTLAYFAALGAGFAIPVDIQKELQAAQNARAADPLVA